MISKVEIFGTTDVGQVRDHNEDNFVICKDLKEKSWNFKRDEQVALSDHGALLVVADGMGGTNAGEVASHLAQEVVKESFDNLEALPETDEKKEKLLEEIIVKAHKSIVKHQETHLETAGMGTTLVIAWVIGDKLHVGWSGDSRCYVFHGQERLLPLTDDHSLVWDMVKNGEITPEEARQHPESNIITQSLGEASRPPKPSSKSTQLYQGDKVMVCSDGLNGMLSDDQIRYYLNQDKPVADICKDLTQAANQAGGTDNITTLMLEVLEGEHRPEKVSEDKAATVAEDQPEPNGPTTTQVLRSKNKTQTYLLVAAGIIVIALLLWILLFSKGGEEGGRTVIKMNEKTYEYTSGKTHRLDLVSYITDSEFEIDSFYLEGIDFEKEGNNGWISFMINDEDDREANVRLYPKSKDSVYIAELMFKARHEPGRETPVSQPTEEPGESRPGNETVEPGGEAGEEELLPGDTSTQSMQEPPAGNEAPLEEEEPQPGQDTTEPAIPQEPLEDTTASPPAQPPLNRIQKEEPDTSGNQ